MALQDFINVLANAVDDVRMYSIANLALIDFSSIQTHTVNRGRPPLRKKFESGVL